MVDRGVYRKELEPIVQANEFVQTFPKIHYYRMLAVYPLPLISVDICDALTGHLNAALVAATESAEAEIPEVYLEEHEISQLRMIPREDFDVTWLAKPKARPFLTIKNVVARIPTEYDDPRTNPAIEDLNLNEIYQFEKTKMWLKATSNVALAAAHIDFFGFRFIIEEVTRAEIPKNLRPTVLPTEGWSGEVAKVST